MQSEEKKMVNNKRSFLKYIFLTLITFGIYHWIFMYHLIEDVNLVCDGDGQDTPGVLKFLLLTLLTLGIYGFYWFFKLGNRLAENAARFHIQFQERGTTILLWMVLGGWIYGLGILVAWYLIIRNMNSLAGAYNAMYYGTVDCVCKKNEKE